MNDDGPVGEVPPDRTCYTDECGEPCRSYQRMWRAEIEALRKANATIAGRLGEARARLRAVEAALAGHPVCEKHPDDDVIRCGWKSAVRDAHAALSSDAAPQAAGVEPDRLTEQARRDLTYLSSLPPSAQPSWFRWIRPMAPQAGVPDSEAWVRERVGSWPVDDAPDAPGGERP